MPIQSGDQDYAAGVGRRLADAYADRHEHLDRFILMYFVPRQALSRIGIELQSPSGYVLLFAGLALAVLLPSIAIAWLTDDLGSDLVGRATIVSAVLGALNVAAFVLAQAAARSISAVHRALADEDQVRVLMAWDRRWYSPSASAVVGGSIAAGFLVVLYVLSRFIGGVEPAPTTIWFSFAVALFLGQFTFSIAMIFAEFRAFTRCRFDLYALRPIETVALQTTDRGLKQLGVVSIVLFPLFNLVLLSVLPGGSNVSIPVTIGSLLLTYLATAVGILSPFGFLGTIVKREKERQLRPLEDELNAMVPLVGRMSEPEYEKFRRLETLRNAIADSADSFLSLASFARIIGAAVISTVAIVATAVVQFYLERTL